jgi:choice-of-anchor A domain-containing protein/RHS repeat-associated protein
MSWRDRIFKSWLRFEPLEDRTVPAFTSPPNQALADGTTPLAIALGRLNADQHPDLAVLGRDGKLTTSLNNGLNSWLPASVVDLGVAEPSGLALGALGQSAFADLVVQTPDGLLVARGDGFGRFGTLRAMPLGPSGVFAGPDGARVEPAVAYLAGDTFADVVTVAPGSDQVVVLKGDSLGGFAAPVRFWSGGSQPVSVLVGQFVGDAVPDLVVGHRSGSLTVFQGNASGTFTARPALTVTLLGTVTGLAAADFNNDGELDVAVSGTDRTTVLLNRPDPAPTDPLTNGDFSQGLTGWEVERGQVAGGGAFAQFREHATSLLSSLRQRFTVPNGPASLSFDLSALSLESPAGVPPDAFEVSLLDDAGNPLVTPFRADATAFFNVNPGNQVNLAPGVSFDGQRVTLNISHLTPGTHATVVFDLIGNRPGLTSTASIDNVRVNRPNGYADGFTTVALAGPFETGAGVAAGDVDGDNKADVVVADGSRVLVFNGNGQGGFTRDVYDTSSLGSGAASVAVAPLTSGDLVADPAVGFSGSTVVASPLTPITGTAPDQLPRLRTITPPSGAEGSPVTLTATFDDPDGAAGYTATIDWGDGSTSPATVTYQDGVGTVTGSHTYADNGTYSVRVIVRSANSGPVDYQDTTATITNTGPAVSVSDIVVNHDGRVEVQVGTFTDPGFSLSNSRTRETFLATIDWGDGTPTPYGRIQLANGAPGTLTSGTVFGQHRYARPGVYTARLTVRDDDGGETTQTFTVTARPAPTDQGVWWVPGNPGETVLVQFDLNAANTNVENELGYFVVQDVQGRVSGLLPSDIGYAAVAFSLAQRGVIFPRGSDPGAANWVNLPAGTYVAFYLVRDNTTTALTSVPPPEVLNPDIPVWLSTTAANADGGTQHFQRTDQPDGWVKYSVEDGVGGGDQDFDDHVFTARPAQPGPVIQSVNSVSGGEGQSVTLTATFGSPDPTGPFTATVNWGDGTTTGGTVSTVNGVWTVTASHVYADNGSYPITVTVTDPQGLSDSHSTPAAISNVAPSVVPAADRNVLPGAPLSLTAATFSDPGFTSATAGTQETFTSSINWGDGSAVESGTLTVVPGSAGTASTGSLTGSHTYDNPGAYTVSVTITDDDGGAQTRTFVVTVTASTPVITSAPNLSGNEGQSLTLTAAFTDGDPADAHTATITWGDGSTTNGTVSFQNGQGTVTASHTYADNSTYPVTLTVTDRYGRSATRSLTAAVANVAPAATPAAAQTTTAGVALNLTLAAFTDPGYTSAAAGTQETFTATVNWGDGTATEPATVSFTAGSPGTPSTGTVTGTHTYTTGGTFTVSVTVADDDGGSTTVSFLVTVSVPGLGCCPMAAPVITGISRATSVGSGSATTADTTLVISGTGEPGATITVNRQGVGPIGSTVVGGDGTWRFDYTGTTLAAGTHTFTAVQYAFGPLGAAGGFNAFVLTNVSGIPDAEGRLAAGGNITLSNFSVGHLLTPSGGSRDDLIAGGALNLTGGQVYNGNAVYGTTRNVSANTSIPQGALRKDQVIDFAAAFDYLRGRADTWAALTPTGTTAYSPTGNRWAITLTGTDAAFNVFTVDGAKLSACSGFTINAPATSTVLVNVTGTSGSMENFAFSLNGVTKQHVLFNFAQYTALQLNSIGVAGSVLAPRADVNFIGGNLDGTLVATSLTGGGELHHFPLQQSCPSLTSGAFTVTAEPGPAEGLPKFFVVGPGTGSRYSATGTLIGTSQLTGSTGTPVGVAANPAGTATWVATANPDGTTTVVATDRDGSVRGTWRAWGVTDARDIGVSGTDAWVVGRDAATNALKVFRFANGTKILSGGLEPVASFALNGGNTNPTGLATDGWNVFVTDSGATGGRVFAYDINGNLLGGSTHNPWRLDGLNTDPSGVTLNPGGGSELWVVDKTAKKVFTYSNGRNNHWWNSGGPQAASSVFALNATDPAPEGIADPDPIPITLGQVVNGQLTAAGEQLSYVIDLTAGQTLYFDALPYNFSLLRNLTGPTGNPTTDYFYDSFFNASQTGQYTLTVYSPFVSTASFSFRVVEPTNPPPVTIDLDQFVDGTFSGPGVIPTYQFQAGVGQVIYFDRDDTTPFVFASLTDPTGDLVFFDSSGDADVITLPEDGWYTVAMRDFDGLSSSFRFRVVDVPPATPTPISLGDTVTGSIDIPGQVRVYALTLATGARVEFEPVSGTPAPVYWSLTQNGTEVFTSDFDSGPITRWISAGITYTLTVDAQLDSLPAFEFRVEPAPPVPLTLDEPQSGTFEAAEDVHSYTFTAAAGQQVLPAAGGFTNDGPVVVIAPALWVLTDADGIVIATGSGDATAPVTLPATGTYTLTVSPQTFSEPAEFTAAVWIYGTTPPATLESGTEVNGRLATKYDQDNYTFDAAAGQWFSFRSLQGDSNEVRWRLTAPSGQVIEDSGIPFPGFFPNYPIRLTETGAYKLDVIGNPDWEFHGGDGSELSPQYWEGDYAFQIGVQTATPVGITIGQQVTGTIPNPGEVALYTFTAAPGQRVWLDVGQTNFLLRILLTGPGGETVYDSDLFDSEVLQLGDGEHTLAVRRFSAGSGPANFDFRVTDTPITGPVAITPDTVVSGGFTAPGGRNLYTFTATAGQQFYLDLLTAFEENVVYRTLTVYDPDGNVLYGLATSDIKILVAPEAGEYTIAVDERPALFGYLPNYQFVLRSVETVTVGQDVQRPLAGGLRVFKFTGDAGDRLFFDMIPVTGSDPYPTMFTLLRPDGTLLWSDDAREDVDTFILPVSGDYTLIKDGQAFITPDGEYHFRFITVDADQTQAAEIGDTLVGAVTLGQRQRYQFTAQAGTELLIDIRSNPSGAEFTLLDPSGQPVFSNRDGGLMPIVLLSTGQYTLVAKGYRDQAYPRHGVSGAFQVRLQEVPTPTPEAPDGAGTEYWLTFPDNYQLWTAGFISGEDPADLTLFLAGDVETSGVVVVAGINFAASFTVTPGQVTAVKLPPQAEVNRGERIENKGIHILSFAPVTAYGLTYYPFDSEAYRGIPVNALGREHIILTHGGFVNGGFASAFTVVATQNNTTLTITPTAALGAHPVGVPFNITLNTGQVYNYGGNNNQDVTGSIITSDKPVAVYGSHSFTYLPTTNGFGNPLLEQLPSVETWGRRYVTVPFAERTAPTMYRVLASANGTEVRINGELLAVLNRGQFVERLLTTAAEITGTAPIMVGQYSLARTLDNSLLGDPSFAIVPSFEQYRDQYTIQSIDKPTFVRHFLNLTIPTAAAGTVMIDGEPVPASEFTPIPGSDYSYAQVEVEAGTHTLTAAAPFGVTAYGYTTDDIYSYTGGSGFAPLARVASLTLTPEEAEGITGVAVPFAATVLDSAGHPVAGVRVDFTVTGANPQTGFAYTNASGVAQFSYVGSNLGSDTVTAVAGTFSDTSTVNWALPAAPPTVVVDDPADGSAFPAGQTVVVTGVARAGTATGRVTLVTVNGRPADAVDASGRFFARVTLVARANAITVVARDTTGQTAAASITLTGTTAPPVVNDSWTGTPAGQLTFTATTFDRRHNRLLADAVFTNTTTETVAGPVAAAFSEFDPANVTLHGAPLTPLGEPYALFPGRFAPGASSAAVRVGFDDPSAERFGFAVRFLTPENAAPSINSTPRTDAAAGRAFTDTLTATDPDGDPVEFRLAIGPESMSIDPLTGEITWTPPTDLRGPVGVVVEARDGRGSADRLSYQVDVRDAAANRPPVFRSVPLTTATPGGSYSYTPDVFDPETDAVSFAESVVPAALDFDPATGQVSSASAPAGLYTIKLVATDGRGGRTEQWYVLDVGGAAGSAVAITSSAPDRGTVGQEYTYLPTAVSSSSRPVTFSLLNPLPNVAFDTATGLLTWTPTPSQAGPRTFVLAAADGIGTSIQTFTVNVAAAPVNRAPAITSRPPLLATQNQPYTYTVTAFDPDEHAVVFGIAPETEALGFDIDPTTGVLTWTPGANLFGTYRVTVTATGTPGGAIGQQSFLVEVRAANTAPTVTASPAASVLAGQTYFARFAATDAENDAVRFSLGAGALPGMAIDPADGFFVWDTRRGPAPVGSHTVAIQATDERGLTGTYSLTVTVLADTVRPTVVVIPDQTQVTPGQVVTVRVYATDNLAVTSLTLTADGVPVTLDEDGVATITAANAGSILRLVATAADAAGNSDTAAVSVRVSDPADTAPPVITITSPAAESAVSYLTPIRGTVTDAHLDTYRVEVARFGTNEWRTIATGTTPVVDGVLATFDPTLLDNDRYVVRVVAVDVNGQVSSAELPLELTGQAKLGNFRQEFVDLDVPLSGIPVKITRVYDSLMADQSGDFGYGWSLGSGYNPRVRETVQIHPGESLVGMFAATAFKEGTRVYVNTPDGRRVGFTFQPQPYTGIIAMLGGPTDGFFRPYFKPDAGVFETLEGEHDGDMVFQLPLVKSGDRYYLAAIGVPYNPLGYRLTTKDGLTYHFGQTGGVLDITDRNGVKLTFTAAGIFSSLGPSITFQRDAHGRIEQISDPDGNPIKYEYDALGNLVSQTDQADQEQQYKYTEPDRPHFLTEVLALCGCFTSLRVEYGPDGRLARSIDGEGNVREKEYDLAGFTETDYDAYGRPTEVEYDARGNITKVTSPRNDVYKWKYDANDNPTEFTDARGGLTKTEYDGRGNVTRIEDQLGNFRTFTVNEFNLRESATDARGYTTTYRYDTRGNLVELTDEDGKTAELTYDAHGRRTSLTDRTGATTTYEFETALGQPTRITNPDGSARVIAFDGLGKINYFFDEDGRLTFYERRANGQLTKIYDHNGDFAEFTYNARGQIDTLTDSRGKVTEYEYDKNGRQTKVTDPENGTTVTTYDKNGQVSSVTDPNNHTHTYTYDELGRLTKDQLNPTYQYTYDGNNNVTSVIDPNGHTWRYEYDLANRLVRMIDPLDGVTRWTYDGEGNVLTYTDPNDHTTTFTYDPLGRPSTVTDPEGGVTSATWDAEGRQLSETDPNAHTETATYDSRGRMVTNTDPAGGTWQWEYSDFGDVLSATDPVGGKTVWTYDALHRMTSETDPTGAKTQYEYDSENNVTKVTDPLNRITRYTYDGLNRIVTRTDALDGVYQFTYDGLGNVLTMTDPLDKTWEYTYDVADRLSTLKDPLGNIDTWSYDDNGNLTGYKDGNNHVSVYAYDKLNRLVKVTDPATGVTEYGYDKAGNLTLKIDPLGHTLTSKYDKNDRLVETTDESAGVRKYAYDRAGNLTEFTDEVNRTWKYTYDEADRRTSAADPLGSKTLYGYDLDGRLVSVTDVLGNLTKYEYDGSDRITSITDPVGRKTRYTYDKVGNLTSIIDRNNKERQLDYDALDRLIAERWRAGGTDVRTITYGYDKAGQLTSASDPDSSYTFTYDDGGWLASVDNLGTPHQPRVVINYTYDNAGNLTRTEDNFGVRVDSEFDPKNRLVKRSWSGGGVNPVHVELSYQKRDGILSIDRFKDDPTAGTSELVIHGAMTYAPTHEMTGLTYTDKTGAVLADYSYTFDKAGRLTSQTENGQTTIFTYDQRGQLTLADHAARPDEVFDWDPNGNPTGAVVQPDNRVTDDGEFTYEYDGEGNRTKKTDKATGAYTVYVYDHRERLTSATVHSATGSVEHASTYTYDAFDRRIGVTSDGVQTWTVYDGQMAWADFDSAGAVTARYLAGIREDELWARWRPADGTAWYLQDRMFSVRDITNADGVVIDHIEYDQFGLVLSETNPAFGDRFKYTGREYDAATGLYHYRARAYDPESGTFLQQDPLGFEAGDTNLYRYVFNAPTIGRDPSGEMAIVEYAVQLLTLLGILPSGDWKICMSEETTRIVYTLSADAWGAEAEIGIVIANHGIPVPKFDQMTFCVESCADLGITAFANGVFGVTAMSIEMYNLLMSGDVIEAEIEYAEPDEAMGLWKLRVSASCGGNKLQNMADGRGPRTPDITIAITTGENTGYSTDIGWTNPKLKRKAKVKKVKAPKDPHRRPKGFRSGVRDAAWEAAKGPDGKVRDPHTGKVMKKSDPWDMGHKPGYEFCKHKASAKKRGIDRKQFLDEHNDASHYRPELPSSNRSHAAEDHTGTYLGP